MNEKPSPYKDKSTPALDKEIVKEALQEWLDRQFAAFGKWTLAGLVSAALAGAVYLWFAAHGWAK